MKPKSDFHIAGQPMESHPEYSTAYTGLWNAHDDVWYYQINGYTQWSYAGLVQDSGTWYYVENGAINWKYTGLVNY